MSNLSFLAAVSLALAGWVWPAAGPYCVAVLLAACVTVMWQTGRRT